MKSIDNSSSIHLVAESTWTTKVNWMMALEGITSINRIHCGNHECQSSQQLIQTNKPLNRPTDLQTNIAIPRAQVANVKCVTKYLDVYVCKHVCLCNCLNQVHSSHPSGKLTETISMLPQHSIRSHHTEQMWVVVLEPCKWRKINYQGSESISHGFSITLRMVAMKQLQLWNIL